MSIEEAILELLKVHNRVILPGFGAFLVAKDDPEEKPYVLFNSFLSFNDGLLVGYLAEQNKEDSIAITDQVASYVSSVKATLEEERLYKFNSLGSFDFEEGGAMRFRFNPNTGKVPVKPGAHAKPVAKKVEPKKEEAKIVAAPIPEPAAIKEDLLNIDSSTPPTVIIEQDNSVSAKGAMDIRDSKFELVEEKYDRFAPHSSSLKVEDKVVADKVVADSVANDGKKKGIILIVAAITVVLLGLGYVFLIHLPSKRAEEARMVAMAKEAQHQAVLKHQSDSIAVVKTRELAIADSIRVADELAQKAEAGPYQIVIGAFTEEANADKLLAKVKASGFSSAKKLVGTKMFFVSAEGCSDLIIANKRLTIISNTLQMDCWIYKSK